MSGFSPSPPWGPHAAHWVRHFSLFRVVVVHIVVSGADAADRNMFGVPSGAAGGGAFLAPTEEFTRYCRWSVAKCLLRPPESA